MGQYGEAGMKAKVYIKALNRFHKVRMSIVMELENTTRRELATHKELLINDITNCLCGRFFQKSAIKIGRK
jgi:hypothetical protein